MNGRRFVIITSLSLIAASCASSDGEETEAPSAIDAGYDFAAIDPIVADFVDERDLTGAGLVIVHADDGVVHEGYWGDFSADRISLVASSSKMITAGVLLALQDDGLLDIDAPISDVADWGAGNPDITPAQLISNSSGLVGLDSPIYGPYLCQFIASGTLQECGAAVFETPDDDADIIAPDTDFRYGGAQWQVAGAVAEVASGMTWAELIDEIYVEPCGLEALGFNNHYTQILSVFGYPVGFAGDPSSLTATDNPNMEGGAYVTTGDYAKLLLMHLRGGMCGDNQVLSQEALDAMHADRIAVAYDGSAGVETGYGMGWWVDRESGLISNAGLYGSVPWLDLEDGYGVYLVIEADGQTGEELAALLEDVIDDAINAAN
jgi:CubicO group peptidase (beta-lactamase class C family)